MTDEQILKLIKSTVEEDVLLGMNFLAKRSLVDIEFFLKVYGRESTRTDNWVIYYDIIALISWTSDNYIILGDKSLLWDSHRIWIITTSEYTEHMDTIWKNAKI